MNGNEIKLPVQLGKYPLETPNLKISEFYNKLLEIITHIEKHKSHWSICNVNPVDLEDTSFKNIISYVWEADQQDFLIIVNYNTTPAKAHIKIKGKQYGYSQWSFKDLITDQEFKYFGKDLDEFGLFIQLNPWKSHIFQVKMVQK
jgi:hypothetical protein